MTTSILDLIFDSSGPLGLSKDFFVNLAAGEVSFAIEVILILIFLPSISGWLENRKWKRVRQLFAERLFTQNEQLNSWWLEFTVGCLDPKKYDGTVRTPEIFKDVDRTAEHFSFAMNSDIAKAYADYRIAIGRIESLFRRLCIKHGANTAGNLAAYSEDLTNPIPVAFSEIKTSFLKLLNALGYTPTSKPWWDYIPVETRQAEVGEIERSI